MLSASSLIAWQDREYVARDVALAPAKHRFDINLLDAVERQRLNSLKPAGKKAAQKSV
jgi:hypothetical protein